MFYLSQGIQTGRQADGGCTGAVGAASCSAGHSLQTQLPASSGHMQAPCPCPSGSPGAATATVTAALGSAGAAGKQLTQTLSRVLEALLSALGFQLLSISPWPSRGAEAHIPALRLLLWSLPTAHPALWGSALAPMGRHPVQALLQCSGPQSLSPAQRPPLSVPASPSQLCKSSLGIWFLSSWQCHPPKCHGMQKSMKTRGLGHVFLFVCMCQHFQWLRNVCL